MRYFFVFAVKIPFIGSHSGQKNLLLVHISFGGTHTIVMLMRFLIYGMTGWVMEVFWTGIHSLWKKDRSLMGYTSLWMFPIYGMAVFLEPICLVMKGFPLMMRGGVYMLCIFSAEYLSGWGLQRVVGLCPWNYSDSHYHINGLIRLDYAPLWFGVGLLFEEVFFRLS